MMLHFMCDRHGHVCMSERFAEKTRVAERGLFCSRCILDAPDADPQPMTMVDVGVTSSTSEPKLYTPGDGA